MVEGEGDLFCSTTRRLEGESEHVRKGLEELHSVRVESSHSCGIQ